MDKNNQKISSLSSDRKTTNNYDDGNIPREDLPQNVTPDEVPRKDGPGGEGEK